MKEIELVSIDMSGVTDRAIPDMPDAARENCAVMADFYKVVGFEPPWIGYLALFDGQVVGGGAFKGPPRQRKIEIAYYTLGEYQRRGFATATARELIAIAKAADPAVRVTAQTLPERNASTAILEKLGFSLVGTAKDPDVGEVWEWYLNDGQDPLTNTPARP